MAVIKSRLPGPACAAESDPVRGVKDDEPRRRGALGRRIREWRVRRQQTGAAVAEALGIGPSAFSNHQRGARDLPAPVFLRLFGVLKVPSAELLDTPEVLVLRRSLLGEFVELHLAEGAVPSDGNKRGPRSLKLAGACADEGRRTGQRPPAPSHGSLSGTRPQRASGAFRTDGWVPAEPPAAGAVTQ